MTKILIIEARFYDDISEHLVVGAMAALDEAGAGYDRIEVSGALEIPAVIAITEDGSAESYDGYVALGCVIRGETSHYDIVAGESARGLMDLSILRKLAIGNGILTCETREQALARADMAQKDKGGFAVRAVLEMIGIQKKYG